MEKRKKFMLQETDIPTRWYNITADMKNKPQPMLNPQTKEPLKAEDLYPLFAEELSRQEVNQTDAWIDIPEEVREKYKIYRPTPLVRATGLEKALDTPAHIYFKNESVSPVGSHKLNSALPQAYYNKMDGTTNITTETGAGQWGTALAFAAKTFGLELAVYMVKISYEQKPYRRSLMQTWGAQVIASPSMSTKAGRKIITDHPNYQGSLGTAISEAIELAMQTPNCKYTLGSVLNHVALHQTIIGLEAEKQMEMAGEYPDVVIGCFGGGSNFSGITFPFLRHNMLGKKNYPFRGRRTGVVSQAYPWTVPVRFWRRNRLYTADPHVHTGTQVCTGQHSCRRTPLPWCRKHREPTAQGRAAGSYCHQATGDL